MSKIPVDYYNRKHWGWSERAMRLYALTFHAHSKANRLAIPANGKASEEDKARAHWYDSWSDKLLKQLNKLPPGERGEQ